MSFGTALWKDTELKALVVPWMPGEQASGLKRFKTQLVLRRKATEVGIKPYRSRQI
jgi:hypothetical protein